MQISQITLDKRTNIWTGKNSIVSCTMKQAAEQIALADNAFIPVKWSVVTGISVSVEKQNARMLRRINKLAEMTGKEVSCFDQINSVIYGAVIS